MSLELWDAERDFQRRLEALELTGITRISLHENRTVMVSVTGARVLRIHRGYLYAPDRVLRAIVRFAHPAVGRREARKAIRELLAFPVQEFVPPAPRPRRTEPPRPGDVRALAELERRHAALNRAHFGGTLGSIPFRLSGRMRSRLGELVLDRRRRAAEIVISRRHLRRDGWSEVEQTLLHEMVHQWQAETGRPVDHGKGFKRKARDVGIEPHAWRRVGRAACS